ncbi:MAG: hypothetical protein IPO30_20045 [Hyphomonadaceae bacterium]|nr:hypothetical protein [Hyphomonadaceae bacterium]
MLSTPIGSREEAKNFLQQWLHDELTVPLRLEMLELRTVLAPERFAELSRRIRELDDDAHWQQHYRDPDHDYRDGDFVQDIIWEIEGETAEDERRYEALGWDDAPQTPIPSANMPPWDAVDDAGDEELESFLSADDRPLYDHFGRILRE